MFNVSVQFLYPLVAFCLVLAGLIVAWLHVRTEFQPGKRRGAVLAFTLINLQWLIAASCAMWIAPAFVNWVWTRPEALILVLTLAVSAFAFFIIKWILSRIFRVDDRAGFVSLVPRFTDKQVKLIAAHEAGHLLVHASVDPAALPRQLEARITTEIVGVAGYVRSFTSATGSRELPSAAFVAWESLMLLAGDLATDSVLGERYTGAASDMQKWSELAHLRLVSGQGVTPWPQGRIQGIEQMQLNALQQQYAVDSKAVMAFLNANRGLLEEVAEQLASKRRLDRKQCLKYLTRATDTQQLVSLNKSQVHHHRKANRVRLEP